MSMYISSGSRLIKFTQMNGNCIDDDA